MLELVEVAPAGSWQEEGMTEHKASSKTSAEIEETKP